MKTVLAAVMVCGGAVAAQADNAVAQAVPAPVPLVFDTDMGNDVDDVLALGLIHALQSRGHCRLIAVTSSKDHPLSAPFIDAVNTFYGRGDIPVGAVRGGVTPGQGKYLGMVEAMDGGTARYPHRLGSGVDAPEAVGLLRKALAAEADGSVAVVQVGFSTNLARLLDSPADENSPLPGRDLVARKVRVLSLMFGAFQPVKGKAHQEYNVVQDLAAARKLVAEWPVPVVFSGFEVGIAIPYPAGSILRDYSYAAHHPLADSYRLYEPPPHCRPTWDLTSVLYAVWPDRGYFDLSPAGRVTVAEDGVTAFAASAGGPHRHLTVAPEQITRVTETFVQLCSQSPDAR